MTSSSLLRLISVLLGAILRPTTHVSRLSHILASQNVVFVARAELARASGRSSSIFIISIHINFKFSHIYAFRFDPGHLQI
jgi:hypothetical protein